jgi:hypothetical protein
MPWLDKEGLITQWQSGPEAGQNQGVPDVPDPSGVVFQPTTLGISLFLWGLGRPDDVANFYRIPEEELTVEGLEIPTENVIPLSAS